MSTFGKIKTKIEKASIELYGKPSFKGFINQLKTVVLENKDIAELYYIYDDLSEKKGLPKDIVDTYVNESIEYSQILIESNKKTLSIIDKWITSIVGDTNSNYKDIDNTIYLNSIKELETVLESKTKIKSTLISEEKKEVKESVNLPLKTMLSIANKTLSKELSNLTESDKEELKTITSLNKDELKKQIDGLKESVSSKLKLTLNESKDVDLSSAIQNTINKVNGAKYDHYNLYKLRKLNLGL
jgi:hypothetical protein